MLTLDHSDWIMLFKQYDAASDEAAECLTAELTARRGSKDADDAYIELQARHLDNQIANAMQNWFERQGVDLASQADTPDLALELAVHAAAICSQGLPDAVRLVLAGHLPVVAGRIADWLTGIDWRQTDDTDDRGQLVVAILLEWLGESAAQPAVTERLLDQFSAAGMPAERIADGMRGYLYTNGEAVLEPLISRLQEALERTDGLDASGEYLLIFLTEISRELRQDKVYRLLRRAFLEMRNQTIGAICLGDYGDGRAVAFLRGWYLRQHDLPRDLAMEVLSSINRLGGQIDDLPRQMTGSQDPG